MIGNIGWQEITIIFVIILILFGAKRLPGLARALGNSVREFKSIGKDIKESVKLSPKKK